MTPKEKANDLALKFCSPSDIFCPNIASLRNAEICVDELINENANDWDIARANYWNEVKQELYKCRCS